MLGAVCDDCLRSDCALLLLRLRWVVVYCVLLMLWFRVVYVWWCIWLCFGVGCLGACWWLLEISVLIVL